MSRLLEPVPARIEASKRAQEEPAHGGKPGFERQNFFWLVVHQVLFRVGWVFKTESIVMPYFLDLVGGGPVVRSLLMVLNRLGASIPPTLYARKLKLMPQKRFSLMATTIGSGLPFAVMSVLWASDAWKLPDGSVAPWTKWFFLAMYAWFFVITGLNQLSIQTVQGKMVRAERRGRLFSFGVLFGSPLAIVAVTLLMTRWLMLPDGGFGWIFAAPAVAFTFAGLTMLAVREVDDTYTERHEKGWRRIRRAAWLPMEDARLRPVAITAALFASAFTLFPHYQSLARESAGLEFDVRSLVTWTVTQHIAVAVISLLAGPIADRFGSRRAVQLTMFGSVLAPITAIALALSGTTDGGQAFWLVFLPLGFSPVTNKMLLNYTLELVPREQHPLYTSSVGLCLAVPVIIGAPIVGVLIRMFGTVPIFVLGTLAMLLAGAQTLMLPEPRQTASQAVGGVS